MRDGHLLLTCRQHLWPDAATLRAEHDDVAGAEHQGGAYPRRLHAGRRRGGGRGGLGAAPPPASNGFRTEPACRRVAREALHLHRVRRGPGDPPEVQREYAKRAGRVVQLPTGHHPMLSRPKLLARVLAETTTASDG